MLSVQHIDCLKYLASPFAPRFDFIFADPVFNIGQDYSGYKDDLPPQQFEQFTIDWIIACWNRLNPGCAFVLHGSVELSRLLIRILWQLNLEPFIEQELCWAFNFGQNTYDKFVNAHCRAIVLRKPGEHRKWYVESVLTPSKRLLMNDKRIATAQYKGYVPFGTVWGMDVNDNQEVIEPLNSVGNWGRIQGNNRERVPGCPNQLPIKYVERCVKAYTTENDLVYDPFGGSGTTIVVCKMHKRKCITTDISAWNCQAIKERLEGTPCLI